MGPPRCATHHDDTLLVQQDRVDGLLGLSVHHGLVVLLGVLRVNGGRHFVWRIGFEVIEFDESLRLEVVGWNGQRSSESESISI